MEETGYTKLEKVTVRRIARLLYLYRREKAQTEEQPVNLKNIPTVLFLSPNKTLIA